MFQWLKKLLGGPHPLMPGERSLQLDIIGTHPRPLSDFATESGRPYWEAVQSRQIPTVEGKLPWTYLLPYSGRDEHWWVDDRGAYLTDLHLAFCVTDQTPANVARRPHLAPPGWTLLVDAAERVDSKEWRDAPEVVLVVCTPDDGTLRCARLGNRLVDLVYLNWIIANCGELQLAMPGPAPTDPVFFRSVDAHGVLMPIADHG